MPNNTHHQVDEAFNKFNEAIVILYDDLLNIYPEAKQTDLLHALGLTLQDSGRIRKLVHSQLFTNTKD